MKHEKTISALIILIIGISLFGCGTTQTSVEKNEKAVLLNEHIKNLKFKFNATYAYPLNYKSIYLSPYYDVKVSPDTVQAYLPYYGRAYTAPMDPSEGGIKFISTEFDYDVEIKPEKTYHIIVASLPNHRGADETLAQYINQGYTEASLVERDDRVRISLVQFINKDEANEYLKTLRQNDKFQNAWLLAVRN